MPSVIVVGLQWGDEGKGKIVDYLTENANLVVRYQGGNNAGHTVIVGEKKTALRLIPSGILRPDTRCLLASGVVIEPFALLAELDELRQAGVKVPPSRLGIAPEAKLIMPYHKIIDQERERLLGGKKIGTTGKGIGPAYEDSAARTAIRVADMFDASSLKGLLERNISKINLYLEHVLGSSVNVSVAEVFEQLSDAAARLQPYAANVSLEIEQARSQGQLIVFEGAQGSLLDVNLGTYPFVTSSHTLAGFACASAGCGPRTIDSVIGICKAYTTRVGSGPFPTEDNQAAGERLRNIGNEFGTVTGRPRRCGWFDVPIARRAIRFNGADTVIITKLDVLSGLDSILFGVKYKLNGKELADLPVLEKDIGELEVVYEELPGWSENISAVRSFDSLPKNAQNYLNCLERLLGCEIGAVSVGPEREQVIVRSARLRAYLT